MYESLIARKTMKSIPLSNKSFQKIIQFYLFESPVRTRSSIPKAEQDQNDPQAKYKYDFRRVSKRGVTFQDRNLDGSKLNTLRAAMIRVAKVKLIAVDTVEEVSATAKKQVGEYIVIWKNEKNVSVTEGYFYCIRNAFAHGDFDVDDKMYTFTNESGGKIKGLARLNERSLLSWIELANMDIEDIRRAGK